MWELDHKEGWVLKNGCFQIVVLEKTLERTLAWADQPVNPHGNQLWMFFGRIDAEAEAEASIFWPPDAKRWLTGKDPDPGKDQRQEEKGITEDEMIRWHHWLNKHEFKQTPGNSEGQPEMLQPMRSQKVGQGLMSEQQSTLLGWSNNLWKNCDFLGSRDRWKNLEIFFFFCVCVFVFYFPCKMKRVL